jgi:single-stranded-DNA-specific exonuclease
MSSQTLLQALIEFNQLQDDQIHELYHPSTIQLSQHDRFTQVKQLILEAIQTDQKILIYGDYDADGICSTTILFLTLKKLKAKVEYYIPNRFYDGYGIQDGFVKDKIAAGTDLFILVDNGVSAVAAVQRIKQHKKTCFIIDHHAYTDEPQSTGFIHSDHLTQPHHSLCASGLAQQLSEHLIGYEPYYVCLAGIATLADMMPVWGHNRSLIQAALEVLNQKRYHHIVALLPEKQRYYEDDLSFQLIPKLNAVGRLVEDMDVNDLVKYLSYYNREFQDDIRHKILMLNAKRKILDKQMYLKAIDLMQSGPIICVADESFHEGVVGITAGQLARTYKKPAFVFHRNHQRFKGSARSYGSTDLMSLIEPLNGLVARFGGHSSAAGIEVNSDQYIEFQEALKSVTLKTIGSVKNTCLVLKQEWLSVEVFESLNQFRPFGQGFELPLFAIETPKIKKFQRIRGGVKLSLDVEGTNLIALYFNSLIDEDHLLKAVRFYGRFKVNLHANQTQLNYFIDEFETE